MLFVFVFILKNVLCCWLVCSFLSFSSFHSSSNISILNTEKIPYVLKWNKELNDFFRLFSLVEGGACVCVCVHMLRFLIIIHEQLGPWWRAQHTNIFVRKKQQNRSFVYVFRRWFGLVVIWSTTISPIQSIDYCQFFLYTTKITNSSNTRAGWCALFTYI